LDFSDIDRAIQVYERNTGLAVHPRHPYAGELVYTAFSGSHQDAINKALKRMKTQSGIWAVPYLPIDPMDVGRSYDPIIRFNSQSGKGGAAFILEHHFHMQLPKRMQRDFGPVVIDASDRLGRELSPEELYTLFKDTYVIIGQPFTLLEFREQTGEASASALSAKMEHMIENESKHIIIEGNGSGLVDAYSKALSEYAGLPFEIVDYSQHAMEHGNQSRAVTYIEITAGDRVFFGAGMSRNVGMSSLRAVASAVNKAINQ
jgi:2-isopropylmalate synthase